MATVAVAAPCENGFEAPKIMIKRKHELTSESFAQRKARFVEYRSAKVVESSRLGPVTPAEEAFERLIWDPTVAASKIDPVKCFLDHKNDYDDSALLSLLQRMPKGGILHTHGIASSDFGRVIASLRKNTHFYVWQGDSSILEGTVRAFPDGAKILNGWVVANSLSQDRLHRYFTLPSGLPSLDVKTRWKEFGDLWERVRGIANAAPFYFGKGGVLWITLATCVESNVMYLEIKEPLFDTYKEYDGRELSDEEWIQRFISTVAEFRAENHSFLGARLVLVCLKCQTTDEVRKAFRRGVELKAKHPDFVAGFDMAGPEDSMAPISDFASIIEEERLAAVSRGVDFPLLLHAGETNIPHADQIFDAVALGCERIGHGFALARHPILLEEVLARGISLECCPISNQVLGYCPNLASHPALNLFRMGVPMSISSDDPSMWHYSDVSYDFAAIAKAWHLSLIELKSLGRNSLICSTLRGKQKDDAIQIWEKEWEKWVLGELSRINNKAP